MGRSLTSKIKIKLKKYSPAGESIVYSVKEIKKSRIISILLENKEGISHVHLAKNVGIDRKNLRPYMKVLISEGSAKRSPGKFGLYYPTSKTLAKVSIYDALVSILRKVLSYGYDCGKPGNIVVKKNWNEAEIRLFKFSNLLGALITFILMQSVNPCNEFIEVKDYKKYDPLSLESKWVQEILSRLVSDITLEGEFHLKVYSIPIPLQDLFRGFRALYPQLYAQLKRLWDELPQQYNLTPYWSKLS